MTDSATTQTPGTVTVASRHQWLRRFPLNHARSLGLVALILWTSGFGCLLCCASALIGEDCHRNELAVSGNTVSGNGVETETACASHDCCAPPESSKESLSIEIVSEPTAAAQCCLLAARPGPAAFPRFHHTAEPLLQTFVASSPQYGRQPAVAFNDVARRLRPSTYLFCCALLI